MPDLSLEELRLRLQRLIVKQNEMSREIRELQQALYELNDPVEVPVSVSVEEKRSPVVMEEALQAEPKPPGARAQRAKRDWEKYIGENLISKIGILITVIGVGIGSKYAIDHEMISPLTRILLGYGMAAGLLGFALKLRRNYEAFSAVLLSGALVIMYFLTFSAYSYFGLVPKGPAFAAMVLLTVATVWAAIRYGRQVIAHLGLVGSYAVPFMLSDGSGQVVYLFSYMSIINAGILFVSFKKYWQSLYYSAFGFTWLIYLVWRLDRYETTDFLLALTFACVFFLLFYATFLGYKLVHKKPLVKTDLFLLLCNSFTFYGLGYGLFTEEVAIGLFTVSNALLHALVSFLIRTRDEKSRPLYSLTISLAILYLTLTIPAWLEGDWITLLWVGEAALLFWIGRTKKQEMYEKMAYPLVLVAFVSLLIDWSIRGESQHSDRPFLNVHLLVSLVFVVALALMNWLKSRYPDPHNRPSVASLLKYGLPIIFLVTAYGSFAMEIVAYWKANRMEDLWLAENLRDLWLTNYTLVFLAALATVNHQKIRNMELTYANLGLIVVAAGMTFFSLARLSELRQFYLQGHPDSFLLWMRYTVYLSASLLVLASFPYFRGDQISRQTHKGFELLLSVSIIWLASSELIHLLELAGYAQSDKLAISILWGIAALVGISVGIRQKKKHFRIGAIGLFAIVLMKLFFYDISHLDTLSKTVVFVVLGILLLIISFLYNRFKHLITDDQDHTE